MKFLLLMIFFGNNYNNPIEIFIVELFEFFLHVKNSIQFFFSKITVEIF